MLAYFTLVSFRARISISIFNIFKYYFYTVFVLFINPFMDLIKVQYILSFAFMQVCVSSIEVPDHVHVTIGEGKCLVDT